MSQYHYVGEELELFAQAHNWKAYLRSKIAPWLGPNVLEVGAGIGGTTLALRPQDCSAVQNWLCLEPDPQLAKQLEDVANSGKLPSICQTRVGTLASLSHEELFDSILYIDVLEHIEDDVNEVKRAAQQLKAGGRLIVLAPAHQWLFTPFDQAIGHFRRYSKPTLKQLTQHNLKLTQLRYLDSVGMLASLGNRLLLKSSSPTPKQIAVWDRFLVKTSRFVDPLLGWTIGKSVFGVWTKIPETQP